MQRWRSPLSVLGRIGSSETQYRGPNTAVRSVLPDFLAPVLSYHRYNASIARVALGQSDYATSDDRLVGSSRGAESQMKDASEAGRRGKGHMQSHEFTSYFDSALPSRASSSSASGLSLASQEAEFAHIDTRLSAAKCEADFVQAAKELFHSDALVKERRRSCKSKQPSSLSQTEQSAKPILTLNSKFLYTLFDTSFAITKDMSNTDFVAMDHLVAKYLRMVYQDASSRDSISELPLTRFAVKARSRGANAVLDQLFIIAQQIAGVKAQPSGGTPGSNTASVRERNASLSQLLLNLMEGFSHCGRFDRVQACFDVIEEQSLPANIQHYQLHLIAAFKDRTSRVLAKGIDDVDAEQLSQELQNKILKIKTSMEADGIALDDTFFATTVYGLSAPLRNPLSPRTSSAQANSVLQLVRTISAYFADQTSGKAGKARPNTTDTMPRLLSALVSAEIDALRHAPNARSNTVAQAVHGIAHRLRKLETILDSAQSVNVGVIKKETVSESRLSAMFLRIRLSAALGNMDRGLKQLGMLLSVRPSPAANPDVQKRDLILKQRSAVICLFSAAMQQRKGVSDQDAAFRVLQLAFQETSFDRLWTRTYRPANAGPGYDAKAYDPDATVVRLWKRWLHAWSFDHLAHGNWIETTEGEHRHVISLKMDPEMREKHSTFTGRYPWQTLKRGLRLLNHILDRYELMHASSVSSDPSYFTSAITNRFATLFNEPAILDNLVKLSLRGGRPASNETMATHVERRLTLLIGTLSRVGVPARVWDKVESSMLRHLALIDREVLPTEAVRKSMDDIAAWKEAALLRRLKAEEASAAKQQTAKVNEEEEYPLETGSIFVLRQMLANRQKQHQHQQQQQQREKHETRTRAAFN